MLSFVKNIPKNYFNGYQKYFLNIIHRSLGENRYGIKYNYYSFQNLLNNRIFRPVLTRRIAMS